MPTSSRPCLCPLSSACAASDPLPALLLRPCPGPQSTARAASGGAQSALHSVQAGCAGALSPTCGKRSLPGEPVPPGTYRRLLPRARLRPYGSRPGADCAGLHFRSCARSGHLGSRRLGRQGQSDQTDQNGNSAGSNVHLCFLLLRLRVTALAADPPLVSCLFVADACRPRGRQGAQAAPGVNLRTTAPCRAAGLRPSSCGATEHAAPGSARRASSACGRRPAAGPAPVCDTIMPRFSSSSPSFLIP